MSRLRTEDLRLIFNNLDKNSDGRVSLNELNWLFEIIGVHHSTDELESSIEKPKLDFDEFWCFYDSISSERTMKSAGSKLPKGNNEDGNQETDDLKEAFKVFDLNDDGFRSCKELLSILLKLGLWNERSGKDYDSMIRAYDTNSNERLDFEEFRNMMFITIS